MSKFINNRKKVYKAQSGLKTKEYSGTWGNRGRGNELLSALENGLSWVGDKVVNAPEYIDQGFDWLMGAILPGVSAEESVERGKLERSNPFVNKGLPPLPGITSNPLKGREYTQLLINLLGKEKDLSGVASISKLHEPYRNYLQSLGVDISRFSDKDFIRLSELARNSIINSPTSRHVLMTEARKNKTYTLKKGNLQLGLLEMYGDDVGTIYSNKIKGENGVSEDLYNAAISRSKEGIVSGDVLHSPELTKHIWRTKYPTAKQIRSDGEHNYNSGLYVNKTGKEWTDYEGPVMLLDKPSKAVLPIKSQNIFHPDRIKNGKVSPPNWNNLDPYKVIIPGIAVYGMSQSNENGL